MLIAGPGISELALAVLGRWISACSPGATVGLPSQFHVKGIVPFSTNTSVFVLQPRGPVAQWIRHRPTEPGIVGSSPTGVIVLCQSMPVSPYVWNQTMSFAQEFMMRPCGLARPLERPRGRGLAASRPRGLASLEPDDATKALGPTPF